MTDAERKDTEVKRILKTQSTRKSLHKRGELDNCINIFGWLLKFLT